MRRVSAFLIQVSRTGSFEEPSLHDCIQMESSGSFSSEMHSDISYIMMAAFNRLVNNTDG